MKRYLPFIFIIAFLFPVLGYAANAPQDINPSAQLTNKGLFDIYTRLSDLSTQTQAAITQLNENGITTDQPETSLIAANLSLAKAKTDIIGKNPINKTEGDLTDAKTELLTTLATLKALLPTLDTSSQS